MTAVKFVGEWLLVGQGPILKKYNWKSGTFSTSKPIFARNNIHGISIQHDARIVAWGGRSIIVLDLDLNILCGGERSLNEWIMYSTFSNKGLLIQTAHNSVLCVDPLSFDTLDIASCEENSILYSGTILTLGDRTLVAAGTVLGGVVAWDLDTRQVLFKFTQHEGSIFGVVFSADGRYLVSCSDDRSIRLWDMSTGHQKAIGWGHHARIWGLYFLEDSNSNSEEISIISVSEDCTARYWKLDGETLVIHDVFEGHQGRSVWCGAIQYNDRVLATGGQDGKVLLYDIDFKDRIDRNKIQLQLTPDENITLSKNETFKKFSVVENKLICTSTAGRVFYCFLEQTKEFAWKEIEGAPKDVYTVIRSFSDIGLTCIAVRDGSISQISFDQKQPKLVTTKVSIKSQMQNILPLVSNNQQHYLLIECQSPADDIYVFSVEREKVELVLKRPETFAVECATYDDANSRLFLGSKHGAAAFYECNLEISRDSSQEIECTRCWRRVVSDDILTSISVMPPTWSSMAVFTSADGQYTAAIMDSDNNLNQIRLDKIPKGSIEGSWVVVDRNGLATLYLAVFRQDLFSLYNANEQVTVFSERCGGAHREWLLNFTSANASTFEMFYSKARIIYGLRSKEQPKFQSKVLLQGTHGREIRAISIAPKRVDGPNTPLIVATSSEDTTICFFTIEDYKPLAPIKIWSSQRKHISGIPEMKWTPDNKFLLSCSAQEELLIWKVSVLSGKVLAAPHLRLPTSTDQPDLRIMSFGIIYDYPSTGKLLLATVYSDSGIRLWTVDVHEKSIDLLQSWFYKSCCLLNCDFVLHGSSIYLVISATDGYLTVYNIGDSTGKATINQTIKLHQSSVKSSFIVQEKDTSCFLHVSGGDDNAIKVACVDFDHPEKSSVLDGRCDAHSCTITAVELISATEESLQFVTTSTDQNVRVWDFLKASTHLELVQSRYTAIADTGCIGVSPDGQTILVGGSGLSCLRPTKG